jgi:signal transduction histidine kinase
LLRSGTYVASVALLMHATGNLNSGLGSLLLIPVVAVALYGRGWESAVVVASVVIALLGVALVGQHEAVEVIMRRLVLFGSLGSVISVSIHVLRRRLASADKHKSQLLDHAVIMNSATEQFASLLDPPAIAALGVELAARIATPSASNERRAAYFRIENGIVVTDTQFNESGRAIGACWTLDEHPQLRLTVTNVQPVRSVIDLAEVGPTVRAISMETGVTHGAWVPVTQDGVIHGVLEIGSCGVPVPDDCFERCVALGNLMSLALSNWAAHEILKEQSTADERRRIARELHDGLAHELAFIASKASKGRTNSIDSRELALAADRALDEARRAIAVLSSVTPQPLSLAIAQTAEDLGARFGIPVHLELADDIELPGVSTENLLRIVREAITNAATHGNPTRVLVRLEQDNGVHLVIEDDGSGFDRGAGPSPTGFGLVSMNERATSMGARFTVQSAVGQGTRIEVQCL